MIKLIVNVLLFVFFLRLNIRGQDNYEIQVYPSEVIGKGFTMVELHSNYTIIGLSSSEGVRPTQYSFHETVEITHGFSPWFEIGFYCFTNIQSNYGWQWVGGHIRPRVCIPSEWRWPVGLSLSTEVGYQRREYSTDTWTLEIRPIIDKDLQWIYLSFNPTIGKSLKGLNEHQGFDFEPNFKAALHLSKKIDMGTEYYGVTGPILHADPPMEQSHALYAVVDLNLSPVWEFNFGVGWGLTKSTDGEVVKMILGRRF